MIDLKTKSWLRSLTYKRGNFSSLIFLYKKNFNKKNLKINLLLINLFLNLSINWSVRLAEPCLQEDYNLLLKGPGLIVGRLKHRFKSYTDC